MRSLSLAACIFVLGFGALGCATQDDPRELDARGEAPPEVSFDGLPLVQDTNLARVYAIPELDLGRFNRVAILEVEVAFESGWRRQHRRVTASDMERIKRTVAETFRAVFVEELEAGGYEIVEHAGEDVLLVRPAVIHLGINAPDTRTGGRSRTFVGSSGAATALIDL